jgi:hypothetical protein
LYPFRIAADPEASWHNANVGYVLSRGRRGGRGP